jgi:(p)ppGpp synthase/HD superfamily hydrolase
MNIVEKAKKIAYQAHFGQVRKGTGGPYIVHPVRVAEYLATIENDDIIIAAAYLHDVAEDCDEKWLQIISLECGEKVLQLVRELTNPSKSFVPTDEHFRMPRGSIRRIKKQLDRDHLEKVSWEAKLIKLVDRLDNVTDMKGMDKDFCVLYAQESQQLLDVLRGTHKGLEEKLESAIRELRKRHD